MAQTIKLKRSGTSGAVPTTSQLELGEVAINTYDGKMYIKKNVGGTESIVEISAASADAILVEYQFTATAGQSTFSGSDDNSETLSYTPNAIQVFLNGILLDPGIDFTATNSTSIVLSETVDANDYLQVFAFKKKIGDGNVSVDTFTGDNSTTAFTLTVDPGDENNTRVFIDGVYQSKANYSVSGTTLTFSTAPPTGTAVEVEIGNRVVTLDTLSDLDLPDDVKLRLGTDQDLQIYHDGSNGFIKNTTGDLYIEDTNGSIRIRPKTGESGINVLADSSVELYYDNSKKLETSNDGVTVTGDIEATGEIIGDLRGATLFKAQAGEALTKGEVVYISGVSGNTTVVSKADADDASKMPAFGLVAASASSGNPVDIYTAGILADIDTSSFSEGDELFVSTTAGALTATAPTGESAALQKIGKVTRSDATGGRIFIIGAGRSNATPNLDSGDIFIGNASNQAVSASLNTKIEDYLDGGTSTPSLASLVISGTNANLSLGASGNNIDFGRNADNYITAQTGSTSNIVIDPQNRFVVRTNDTERMRIDSSGRVGIGTTSPSAPLDVQGSTGLFMTRTSSGLASYIENDGGYAAQYLYQIGGGAKVALHANGDSYFAGGDVGIGNTTPGTKLDISSSDASLIGVARIQYSGANNYELLRLESTTNNDSVLSFKSGSSSIYYWGMGVDYSDSGKFKIARDNLLTVNTALTIDSSQNVGIGTTSPSAKLHIDGDGTYATIRGYSQILDLGNWTNGEVRIESTGAPFHLRAAGNQPIHLETDNVERVSILGTGNVGIGTTSPANKLQIGSVGSSNYGGNSLAIGDGTRVFATYINSTSDAVEFYTNRNFAFLGSGGTGNVSIGSTNSGVGGSIDLSVGNTSSGGGITLWSPTNGTHSLGFGDGYTGTDRYRGYVEYAHGDDSMRLATASTERMRIDSSGNLLVGLSSSLTNGKLQIAGGIGLSGNTQIRQATNSDGNTLQVFATQLVAGSLNSSSYSYTGGGLLAGLSNLDGVVILDAGRQTSTGGRFKVVTTSSSNTSLYLEKNGTYTLYADTGSGNVGIGTSSPAQKLHVVGTSRPALIGSDNAVNIVKLYNSATGSTTYNGLDLLVNSTSDSQINSYGMPLTFGTSSSNGTNVTERMRINASGDWMVGNTVANVSSNYSTQAGCGWVEADHHFEIATTNNRSALEVSKNNANDGEIITFRKQSNVVGRLGTFGTDLYIGQNNSGLRFEYAGLDAIVPFDADSVAINDNVITLGHANARFKDLHLSGTSYTNQVELAEISTSNSDAPNDIFIYDTRKDSDGGVWRYRTQHTTWYNETLNTSTRGARKEFPAVAVIIVESDQLTIYDGDDPDMPMWMVFNAGSDMANETLLRGTTIRGAAMLNGILCVATADTLVYIRFIDEYHNLFHTSAEYFFPERTGIVDRNVEIAEPQQRVGGENGTYYGLASSGTKSVSMTVLPNAPIHPTCGLPIPTVGVACGTAGNSIIRHDGKVVDIISGDSTEQAEHAPVFLKDGRVAIQNYDDDRGWRIMNIPEENTTIQNHYLRGGTFVLEWYNSWSHAPSSTQLGDITIRGRGVNPGDVYIPLVEANEHIAIGHNDDGVSLVARQPDDPVNGMSAFIEKDYNTGWMPGATKLAMAPTDSTTFSSNEMITNGAFSNGTTGWSGASATISESGGVLTVTGTRTTGGNQSANATVTGTVTPGEHYILTFEIVEHVANQSSSGVIVGGGEVVENNHLHYWYPNTVGTHTTTIVANNTYLSVALHAGTSVGVITKFDNVSLFRAEPDRSARHRATQLSGSVTRAAVATGAELRAYESFSTGNFMFQNYYNDELNFGTGDFAIACWVKAGNTNSYRRFISIQNPSGTQTDNDAINIKFSPSTNQYIYAYLGSTEGAINTPNVASDVWHHVVLTRRGNHYNMYLNGKLTDTMRSSQSKGSTNHKLYIGKGAEGNEVFTGGSITLIKIAKGTAPSSEQVARMYRDELCMFDENSNITLYGSDSGVRGLAHDDDTNLLHVGTSSGRSVFRGLRRVENTTTAVGATTNAAISASNGLVVENT